MLASLLPGLRDVRAPLVSGALILLSVILLAAGPSGGVAAVERSAALSDLLSGVGRVGVIAGASLLAYLVGSIVVAVSRSAVKRLNLRAIDQLLDRAQAIATIGGATGTVTDGEALGRAVTTRARWSSAVRGEKGGIRKILRALPLLPYSYESATMLHLSLFRAGAAGPSRSRASPRTVMREVIETGPQRVRLASADLHSDFDRLVSEAELRDTLLLPLPVAVVVVLGHVHLTITTEAAVLVASLVLSFVLCAQARRQDRMAYSLLLSAVAEGTISTLSLDLEEARPATGPPH